MAEPTGAVIVERSQRQRLVASFGVWVIAYPLAVAVAAVALFAWFFLAALSPASGFMPHWLFWPVLALLCGGVMFGAGWLAARAASDKGVVPRLWALPPLVAVVMWTAVGGLIPFASESGLMDRYRFVVATAAVSAVLILAGQLVGLLNARSASRAAEATSNKRFEPTP